MATEIGEHHSAERRRMVDHLLLEAPRLQPSVIEAKLRAAFRGVEEELEKVDRAAAGATHDGWSIRHVVDHLAQTNIRAAEELRHLLVGRRPPFPPVYDALTSGAAEWAPWEELVDGLRASHREWLALVSSDAVSAEPDGGAPTVRTILVVNRRAADGRIEPETFAEELGWKGYAMVQQLHALDHRRQIAELRRGTVTD